MNLALLTVTSRCVGNGNLALRNGNLLCRENRKPVAPVYAVCVVNPKRPVCTHRAPLFTREWRQHNVNNGLESGVFVEVTTSPSALPPDTVPD